MLRQGWTVRFNVDESLHNFREPGGTMLSANGVAPRVKPDGAQVGLVYCSFASGRKVRTGVATNAFNHDGLDWAELEWAMKFEGNKGPWIGAADLIYYLLAICIPAAREESGDNKALGLMDNCPMHAAALARLVVAAGGGRPHPLSDQHEGLSWIVELDARHGVDYYRDLVWEQEKKKKDVRYKAYSDYIKFHGLVIMIEGFATTIMFYPPCTTSILQPCDQSIFGWIKSEWRNAELLELWEGREMQCRYAQWLSTIKYKDSFYALDKILDRLTPAQIMNGWKPMYEIP